MTSSRSGNFFYADECHRWVIGESAVRDEWRIFTAEMMISNCFCCEIIDSMYPLVMST